MRVSVERFIIKTFIFCYGVLFAMVVISKSPWTLYYKDVYFHHRTLCNRSRTRNV